MGRPVIWTNNDSVTHTVSADDNSWSSGDLESGESFIMSFTQAGTYAYHCEAHPYMKGTIIVTKGL